MPVAIVGMHRSGTSMLTRMLHLAGLHLGPDEKLMGPAFDNPEGFWENLEFVHLNERLLGVFGGTWFAPPEWPDDWFLDSRLDDIRRAAASLPDQLHLHEPWGWKDPRTTVTLPFWRSLWPTLRIVVCVRNPLEVAASLAQRDGLTLWAALRLWRQYYERLFAVVPLHGVVVCHYEALLDDPRTHLKRILLALSLPSEDLTLDKALAGRKVELHHQGFDRGGIGSVDLPSEWIELYDRLSLAGHFPRPARPTPQSSLQVVAMRQALAMERRADELKHQLDDLTRRHHQLTNLCHQLADFARDRAYWLEALQQRLSARRYRYADSVIRWLMRLTQPWKRPVPEVHHAPPPDPGILNRLEAVSHRSTEGL